MPWPVAAKQTLLPPAPCGRQADTSVRRNAEVKRIRKALLKQACEIPRTHIHTLAQRERERKREREREEEKERKRKREKETDSKTEEERERKRESERVRDG